VQFGTSFKSLLPYIPHSTYTIELKDTYDLHVKNNNFSTQEKRVCYTGIRVVKHLLPTTEHLTGNKVFRPEL
jgi:hypothetical protein